MKAKLKDMVWVCVIWVCVKGHGLGVGFPTLHPKITDLSF